MPTIGFKITYNANEQLILSPSELIEGYLYGIPLCYKDGREMTQQTIKDKILVAQLQLENILSVKLIRQVVQDTADFQRGEWGSFGYIKCTYLIRDSIQLNGFINTIKQITYPPEWISIMNNGDETRTTRTIHIVPAGSSSPVTTSSIIFSGITPHMGFMGLDNIPNYWRVKYCTGFMKIPVDLLDIVGKFAAIQILAILGDVLLGYGTSSQSLSLDGLSQSVSTVRSNQGGLFAGRIKQYSEELKGQLSNAKSTYSGLTFGVV